MEHQCNKEEMLLEMHGDVKTLVAEFKAMNGALKESKQDFEKHVVESDVFRYRITIMWFIMVGIKWAVGGGLLGGVGLLFYRHLLGG